MYGFSNWGKGEPICVLQRRMIMFEFSNNQHCILISSKVVDQVKGVIRMNCFGIEQPNMEIRNNL
jgi:hypothetical protein